MQEDKFIDLEKIIRKKNPRLLKALPGFVLNYIRRIIHEEDVNKFIREHGHKYDFDFAAAILNEFGVKVNLIGTENIPPTGGCIIASNHPLGGVDGIALLHSVGKVRRDIKFLVNDILLNLENLRSLWVPVNKVGKNSQEIIDKIEQTYSSDNAVLIFPAGLVSRKQPRGIKDLEWKKSFINRARKHNRPIVPVYIEGKNSGFFYNFAYWRKKLGIKANIEMFFLVDEMYKQKNKTITLIFGKPIAYEVFDKKFSDAEWAEKLKQHVYEMGKAGRSIQFTGN